MLYVPGCNGPCSLSRSTLARAETQGQSSFSCMQPPLTAGSCWCDACLAERQVVWMGWGSLVFAQPVSY